MLEVMHAHFEAVFHKPFPEDCGVLIRTFRNEVKGRAETKSHLKLCETSRFRLSFPGLNVVGENQGEFFLKRPTGPASGRVCRLWIDRPDFRMAFNETGHANPTQEDTEWSRDKRLHPEIEPSQVSMRTSDRGF